MMKCNLATLQHPCNLRLALRVRGSVRLVHREDLVAVNPRSLMEMHHV